MLILGNVCLSKGGGGVTYPGHLLWLGGGVLTFPQGVSTLAAGGRVPTLAWGGGTYLGWGVPTLGGGYLPCPRGVPTLPGGMGIPTLNGGRVPTLDGGYLPWTEGVPTLDWGGNFLEQAMPWAVRLLQLPALGLSCLYKTFM